ncbi:MAG: hypothetical protein EAZ97_00760 [Bacteroidetes bacterium]|nr:MAG: hypothetical protein EAZ97_00760 [Bacteroidota bacterium]
MLHFLPIRHHGVGSAKNVCYSLESLKPSLILMESPPECETLLEFVNPDLQPPVAMLAYLPDNPQQAIYYPFAEFSPEWQAILYAKKNNCAIRFMDLPLSNTFALTAEQKTHTSETEEIIEETEPITDHFYEQKVEQIHKHPMQHLSEIAGYPDGEIWWEKMFEHRNQNEAFEAISLAMNSLRENLPERKDKTEKLREAFMRKTIRQAESEGYKNIVVICGAWHTPALQNMPPKKDDDELLKNLPKVKVKMTWIPWTYRRLSFESGYGAGITSPGWYHHLWEFEKDVAIRWMVKVATLFREKNMDISSAHLIEAVRLAESLANLRNFREVSLEELNEATQSVLCMGDDVMLKLIEKELIISNRIGKVPEDIPKVPILEDLEKIQKKLRLKPEADRQTKELNLREENNLQRSILLHRLILLGINWGKKDSYASQKSKGTFKEVWELNWEPELVIKTIEMGVFGNTVQEATENFVRQMTSEAQHLSVLTDLLNQTLPAELPKALDFLMIQLEKLAAVTTDVIELMKSVPPLAEALRYGTVRKTDISSLENVVDGLLARIFIALPTACYSLDNDSALQMLDHIFQINSTIHLLQQQTQIDAWWQTLRMLSDLQNPMISGYANRLLLDSQVLSAEESEQKFYFALSVSQNPIFVAQWLEGFLKGSGTILLLDERLWTLLDNWVAHLDKDIFVQLLPLLRRTFSNFSSTERRKIGEKAKNANQVKPAQSLAQKESNFNTTRAERTLPVLLKILGLEK